MRRTGRLVAAAALCLLAAGSRADDDPSVALAAEVSKAAAPFHEKLVALGEWCGASTLMLERSRVADALVLFDADDEHGRTWLRFKRGKDGAWARTSTRPFFDEKSELLPEWDKRRAEVAVPLRAAIEPFLGRGDDWRTAGVRDRVRRALVDLFPDDAALHDAAGETLVAGKWLLKESAATAAGRKHVADAVRAARESTTSLAPAWTVEQRWTSTVSLDEATVHANMSKPEALEVAQRIVQARTLLGAAFDTSPQKRKSLQVWALASPAENGDFLRSRTDVPDERKKLFGRSRGYWLLLDDLVLAHADQPHRVDSAVRHVLQYTYSGIGWLCDAPPCVSEGVGTYLTYALLGTRLTVFVDASRYVDESAAREMADPASDWTALARRMTERGFEPRLKVLFGLPLDSMTKDDGLMAYALAAYFLEGRPTDLKEILARESRRSGFMQGVADVCRTDVDGLEARFVRWLRETSK